MHVLLNLDWKILILIGMGVILIAGMLMGPKGKPRETKHYDQKEKNVIKHHLRAAESGKDYAYKGSGKYRDSQGNVKREK